uniref:Uncharacterized protein n=1 Tax=Mucochytrium quahogii TaxID=96639 RepID=A0A7S2RID2_9STRA|mmetsp:Transcript_15643/g.27280  ORF Transcript_15643/g.27280 Transcript_15643/m.27280 type:complete len:439 (-) Transcript_15643:12-1328(-)
MRALTCFTIFATSLVAIASADCCSFPNYYVGSDCCNIFGCNCGGPCWNAGCYTNCPDSNQVACPGNDGYYDCCRPGDKCKSSATCKAKNGECCCQGTYQVVKINNVRYDFDNARQSGDASAAVISYMYKGVNGGYTPHPVGQIMTTITTTQSQEWSFQSKTTISVSATVEAGVPEFKASLTATASEEFTVGTKTTKSVATSIQIKPGEDMIPPFSRQAYSFKATMIMFKIPFKATATVQSDCGDSHTEEIIGTTTLSGVASFGQGEYEKRVGPAVPIECDSPFGLTIDEQFAATFCHANAQCSTNALCERYGFTGTCCTPGDLKPCCAAAGAHPKCVQEGYHAGDYICPSPKGSFNPCCDVNGRSSKGAASSMLLRNSRNGTTASVENFTFSGSVEQRVNLHSLALFAKAKPQRVCARAQQPQHKTSMPVMQIGCKHV